MSEVNFDLVKSVFITAIRKIVNPTCAVTAPTETLTEEEKKALFFLAKKHDLAHLVSRGLSELQFPLSENEKKIFKNTEMLAVMRYEQLHYEYEEILEAFNAEKIRNGVIKSCEKRPVPMSVIDDLVADISKQVYNSMESEITTKTIGEMVMERLKKVDEVAYVRYASVYRSFKDLSSFMSELKQMMKADKAEKKNGGQ